MAIWRLLVPSRPKVNSQKNIIFNIILNIFIAMVVVVGVVEVSGSCSGCILSTNDILNINSTDYYSITI